MLISNLNDRKSLIHYGNRNDVCYFTARDLAYKEKIDIVTAQKRLRGKWEGEKVVKFRINGVDVTISLDYIHKIAKENPLPKKEDDSLKEGGQVDETKDA